MSKYAQLIFTSSTSKSVNLKYIYGKRIDSVKMLITCLQNDDGINIKIFHTINMNVVVFSTTVVCFQG